MPIECERRVVGAVGGFERGCRNSGYSPQRWTEEKAPAAIVNTQRSPGKEAGVVVPVP
jgi:hypothetical protein